MANQESRVKKSLLNARVNLVFYFLTLALSFFSRKIFLDSLGADFVGLTTTLQNLLGFLNLAELGIGSAIGYVLYKPLFEHDEGKINEIISVFGYLYRWIGFIILGAVSCLVPSFRSSSRTQCLSWASSISPTSLFSHPLLSVTSSTTARPSLVPIKRTM